MRLPAHLLTDRDRLRLHEQLQRYEHLLGPHRMLDAPWASSLITAAEGVLGSLRTVPASLSDPIASPPDRTCPSPQGAVRAVHLSRNTMSKENQP